ncbi:hypothetical protein QAD02_011299 [Eretmocerus hayati]|uniref:Uncharacterized protein n=1 Tax=Eretmocerus hayati TaxID=131215 RepID=A0ACC2NXD0_9HYME|nr:hypothetical protein QAD02_011299 [Eretmocerus hayati]
MIPILSVLYFTSFLLVKTDETKNKSIELRGRLFIRPFPLQDDGSFLYLVCDADKEQTLDCAVHLLKLTGREVMPPITHSLEDDRIGHDLISFRLSENFLYILLVEKDSQDNKYVSGIALDLINKKVSKLALPSDLRLEDQYIGSIFQSNKIELIVGNHSVCGDLPRCKITFNSQGQREGEPILFPLEYKKITSIPKSRGSMDNGIFIIDVDGNSDEMLTSSRVAYIDEKGDPTIVQKSEGRQTSPMYSNTRDLYGVCRLVERKTKFDCVQYDWKSNSTVMSKFSVESFCKRDENCHILSFGNLNMSTFLFATVECGKEQGFLCKNTQLLTVNSDGELRKATHISDNLECSNDPESVQSDIAEIGDEVCVYFVCGSDIGSKNRVHEQIKCFLKSTL